MLDAYVYVYVYVYEKYLSLLKPIDTFLGLFVYIVALYQTLSHQATTIIQAMTPPSYKY